MGAARDFRVPNKPSVEKRTDNLERVLFGFLMQGFFGRLRWLLFGPNR